MQDAWRGLAGTRVPETPWLILGMLVIVLAGAGVAAILVRDSDGPASPTLTAESGQLTWRSGSDGSLHVSGPDGTVLKGVPVDSPAPVVAGGNTFQSPRPGLSAEIVTDEAAGVVRMDIVRDGVPAPIAVLAILRDGANLSPVLAGKVAARAVEGIPLTAAWSPDGRYLAFGSITGEPWFLNLFDATTGLHRLVLIEGGYVGELAWSPDGRKLAISTYQVDRSDHTVLVLDHPAAEQARRVVDGCAVVWSPDSTRLFVHREPRVAKGAWVVPLDGSAPRAISNDEDAFPVSWR